LREEYKSKVFGNKLPEKESGPRRHGSNIQYRISYKDEIRDVYGSRRRPHSYGIKEKAGIAQLV
jgi:hypothetical protein